VRARDQGQSGLGIRRKRVERRQRGHTIEHGCSSIRWSGVLNS
jgi:hypothetical protein